MRLLTPRGLAGVAVVAVEATERAAVLASLVCHASGRALDACGPTPRRAALVLEGRSVDDVLVLARPDDSLELHVHGSSAVLEALDHGFGLRPAAPVVPAERLLREALSPEQLDLAAEQLGHDFDAELSIVRALPAARRVATIAAARARSRIALALATPCVVVLVGQQNAGKSSLFNLLVGRERVLTGAAPGLTRDPVAEFTTLDGYPYEIVDTAGEGEMPRALDELAVARGRWHRERGIQLLVVDGARGAGPTDQALAGQGALVAASKLDLPQAPWPSGLPRQLQFSAYRDDAPRVRSLVGRLLREHRGLPAAGAVGGFAALDVDQQRRLDELAGDCPGGLAPA